MPFYTPAMVAYLKKLNKVEKKNQKRQATQTISTNKNNKNDNLNDKPKENLKLRITPSCVDADPDEGIKRVTGKQKELNFDERKLLYMKTLLNKQVEKINNQEGPIQASDFDNFEFKEEDVIYKSERCTILKSINKGFTDIPMVVKVYNLEQLTQIGNQIYFKILRHLGKKHPYIIQTWEIFIDNNQRVLVMQEFANKGNLADYISGKGPVEESLSCQWAKQLSQALDYMGDMGVCHRAISPKHVLLNHRDLAIRLSGFYDCMIYWNSQSEETRYISCKAILTKNKDVPDFQAPEVYGRKDNEMFEPISADIWSYGAVIYYSLTSNYPYNFKEDNPNVEDEIQENISKLNISKEGIEFLGSSLKTNALMRLTFDRMMNISWFFKFKKG